MNDSQKAPKTQPSSGFQVIHNELYQKLKNPFRGHFFAPINNVIINALNGVFRMVGA